MTDQDGSPIVSDAEVEAALAQAARESNIPTLEDSNGVVAIPVPVQAGAQPTATAEPIEDLVPTPGTDAQGEPARTVPADAGLLYRIVDRALWAVNRPFTWIRPGSRQIIGTVAVITIVMALLAMTLLPAIAPNRHFLTDLKQRCEALAPRPSGAELPASP